MRTINDFKFRAWDTKRKVMLDDFYIHSASQYPIADNGERFESQSNVVSFDDCCIELQNVILMQFTGLQDERGVDAYEGDIIVFKERVSNRAFSKCVINYGHIEYTDYFSEEKNKIHGFFADEAGEKVNEMGYIYSWFISGRFDVIGNIYENPELVKQ